MSLINYRQFKIKCSVVDLKSSVKNKINYIHDYITLGHSRPRGHSFRPLLLFLLLRRRRRRRSWSSLYLCCGCVDGEVDWRMSVGAWNLLYL